LTQTLLALGIGTWYDLYMTKTQTPKSTFKSFDGSVIEVLPNGQAVRHGVTGRMLLTEVGGAFVRYLEEGE
jgi:hypothetical protein